MSVSNKYCAFLRGVNVKGTAMKMEVVCSVFVNAGAKNVRSVLASGNILFESDEGRIDLKRKLEDAMADYFHYDANLFIKNQVEIIGMLEYCPFSPDTAFHNYIFIGDKGKEDILEETFKISAKVPGEEAELINGYFYWKTPKGNTLESEFGKILGKKSLKDVFTSRNMNTIEKVLRKMG